MTDLLPFAENIHVRSHPGTASLEEGQSNFNYTGSYILLAEERENNTCSKKLTKTLKCL